MRFRNLLSGKLSLYAVLFLVGFTSGCRQSAGPVHKLTIDPAKVGCILFGYETSFTLRDQRLIARVVDEINKLSFSPYRPPILMKPAPHIVLKDKNGDAIVEVCRSLDCVWFREPQSAWFCVKDDSSMETAGRLLGYAAYLDDIGSLKFYAKQTVWDEAEQRMAPSMWEDWVTKLYPEPYRSWPTPATPQELNERLKSLPILTLEDLERFPNYFD